MAGYYVHGQRQSGLKPQQMTEKFLTVYCDQIAQTSHAKQGKGSLQLSHCKKEEKARLTFYRQLQHTLANIFSTFVHGHVCITGL